MTLYEALENILIEAKNAMLHCDSKDCIRWARIITCTEEALQRADEIDEELNKWR